MGNLIIEIFYPSYDLDFLLFGLLLQLLLRLQDLLDQGTVLLTSGLDGRSLEKSE